MPDMPTWDQFMAPVLNAIATGEVSARRDIYDRVAAATHLTDEQMSDLLSSGEAKYQNRISWAMTYLTKAKLVSRPRRAHFEITDIGREFLAQHPADISQADLRALPDYDDPRKAARNRVEFIGVSDVAPEQLLDPIEQVEEGIARINEQVGAELLERLSSQKPAFFEQVVVDLIVAMGYGGQDARAVRTQLSNDGGIDGIIDQDILGLNSVYVQAKRYALDRSVQRPEVQAFVGALHGKRATQGVFLTTGTFSSGARDYVQNIQDRIVLIDGKRLATLMIRYRVGVHAVRSLSIVETDEDFFE